MGSFTNLRLTLAVFAGAATLFAALPRAGAQELIAISDIAGGSSVFVFRSNSREAPRRAARSRTNRTRSQRVETAKRVSKQYVALAKVAPRRQRIKAVDPNNLPAPPAIGRMPKDEAAKLFAGVGEYYIDRNDFDNAIDFFREAVNLEPKYAVAINGLSEALALKGNELLARDSFAAAKAMFEEALQHNPRNSPAYYGLGEVYSEQRQDPQALANYEKALQNDRELTEIYVPLGILYFHQGEIAKADELLTKAVAASPDDPQTQYFLGLIRFAQNRNPDALTAFKKAAAADPNYPEAFYYAGETLARLGRHSDAVAEYREAVRLRPKYFESWLGLGAAYFELGDHPSAIQAYREAAKLKNDSWEVYDNLADAFRMIKNYNDAEANYNLAAMFIERQKDFSREQAADIYSKAAFMIAKQCEIDTARAAPCRWEQAIRHLEKATSYSQSSVDFANLGWAYYNVSKAQALRGAARGGDSKAALEKAKANLERAAAANPRFVAGPLMNLGMALIDLGDYAGAVKALSQAVEKEPEWVFALNELGIAYRKQDNLPEAIKYFRRAIAKDEKYAIAHYNLAEAEFRSGNFAEAKKGYETLKRLGRRDLAQQLEIISAGRLRG
jgi:tetratricopeptide (TPR) repeat protein